MRILQVNTFDALGGAARVARSLFEVYRTRGHDSWLAVGHRELDDPNVVAIPNDDPRGRFLRRIGRTVDYQLGIEDFRYPGTWRLLDLLDRRPDVVHGHNLHGGYFDLRALEWLSRQRPLVLTLHDAWLLSGHCGHSLTCERWKIGCGRCPDLTLDPPVRRDATAWNWRRKQGIYAQSRLHVSTPSRWLMDKVEQSMLVDGMVEGRVIPNGVDLAVFRPGDRAVARADLGIPRDAAVVLMAATAARRNPWKDFRTVRVAVRTAAEQLPGRSVLLLALGDDGDEDEREQIADVAVRHVPYQRDPQVVAAYYRAADVYVHAAHAETFPNSIVEAIACGTPVVATAVGGITEQIEDGVNGYLAPPSDATAVAGHLVAVLGDEERRARIAEACLRSRARLSLETQADAYLSWYEELIDRTREPVAASPKPDAE